MQDEDTGTRYHSEVVVTVMRLDWPAILVDATEIVESYDTPVTLRQLFYRLVAKGVLQNTSTAYKTLSSRTAAARREGGFPPLADNTRKITQYQSFDGPDDARQWLDRCISVTTPKGRNTTFTFEKRTDRPARILVRRPRHTHAGLGRVFVAVVRGRSHSSC